MLKKKSYKKRAFNPANYDENGAPLPQSYPPTAKAKRAKRRDFFICQNMIFDVDVSAYAKLVYTFLCRMADSDNQSFPGRKYIAQRCNVSESTVSRAVGELKACGLITVDAQFIDNRQIANLYTVYEEPGGAFNDGPPIEPRSIYDGVDTACMDKPPTEPNLATPYSDRTPSCALATQGLITKDTPVYSDSQAEKLDLYDKDLCIERGRGTASPIPQPVASPLPPPEPPEIESPPKKESHGNLFNKVKLLKSEYESLISLLSMEKVNDYIQRLDAHIASTGRKYRCHFATIYKWANEDSRKEANRINQLNQPKPNRFINFEQRKTDHAMLEKLERAYRDQKYGVLLQE